MKKILSILTLIWFANTIQAQHLWYENQSKTENILFLDSPDGIFTTNELNPRRNRDNKNKTVSKYVRNPNNNKGVTTFKLYKPLKKAEDMIISLKAYIDISPALDIRNLNRLRIYFRNSTTGDSFQVTRNFTLAREWQTLPFFIYASDFTTEGLRNGGYDVMQIAYGSGQNYSKKVTYYIDQIEAPIKQEEQYLWYENDTENENILYTDAKNGVFTPNKTNPDTNGTNVNINVAKFIRDENVNKGYVYFNLYQPIEKAVTYTVNLKAYINIRRDKLTSSPNNLRLFLQNTTTGDTVTKQIKFTEGKNWEDFSFVIDSSHFTATGLGSGGYNQMYLSFGHNIGSTSKTTYYIDQIYGTTSQMPIHETAKALQGSWGTRFYVRGGQDLDFFTEEKSYDYRAGVIENIDSYPTSGHVITNATNNANSHLWTLRTNKNVNAIMGAPNSVVSEEFVPSRQNEQIIIEVINEFKKADKKVILYLNAMSPANRSTSSGANAWRKYVRDYFNRDEHAAWMNYCEGYIKRFAELDVDGYWIDAFSRYPGDDDQKSEFIQMIRNVDPSIMIAANFGKDFFTNSEGIQLLVDSDGVEDDDERDYKIIKLSGKDPWSDITAGHITPLETGAPPNSWSYEEFTVPDIQANPITTYNDGTKQIVKHLFLPIRATWSGDRRPLMFDQKQAYRFVKRITGAGGIVTFSTTSNDGTTMEDEERVLKYVDRKFASNAKATNYSRPLGAFLVEEEKVYPWYENETATATDYVSIARNTHTTTTENFTNPFRRNSNTSKTVLKSKRDGGAVAKIHFNLPKIITNTKNLKISLKALVNKGNPSDIESKIRVYLINTSTNSNIYRQISLATGNTWEKLTFDFGDDIQYSTRYDQVAIGFANGDRSGATATYYFDDLKGSKNQYKIDPNAVIITDEETAEE